jgi:hypothetical protein
VGGAVDMKVSFIPKKSIKSAKITLTVMHSGQKLVEVRTCRNFGT